MIHRHLTHRRLTLAALDDLLENGTLADWRPVLARVRREPDGEVARRLDLLLEAHDRAETGALWRAYLRAARSRGAAHPPRQHAPRSVERDLMADALASRRDRQQGPCRPLTATIDPP